MADDGTSGTPVTLVVPPASVTPGVTAPRPPQHHLPFTGVDLAGALLLGALLLVLGAVLLTSGRKATHPRRT